MRLAISNIAWSADEDQGSLDALCRAGVEGVEVAPTRFWPDWEGVTEGDVAARARWFSEGGIEVPALQAIFYGKEGISLFEPGPASGRLVDHFRLVLDVANGLGAGALVLGAPGLRRFPKTMPREEAEARGKETLRELGALSARRDLRLCVEPIPAEYGGEFLKDVGDIRGFVLASEPGSGLYVQFDTACLALGGRNPGRDYRELGELIGHVHVSEPHLASFEDPAVDHRSIGAVVHESPPPHGWVSIEMREQPEGFAAALRAVDLVGRWYAA